MINTICISKVLSHADDSRKIKNTYVCVKNVFIKIVKKS